MIDQKERKTPLIEIPGIGKVKRPSKLVWGLVAAVLVTVSGLAYFRFGRTSPSIDLDRLTVPAQAEVVRVRITANGTVIPSQSVNLSPKTAGRLARLYVQQGDFVEQGQAIAQMENAEVQAQVLQAQARVDEAQARLNEALGGSRPEEIAQAQARLNQAQAALAQAQNGSTPEEVAQAQARLNQAQANLAQAQNGNTQEEIAQAQARLNQAQATLTQARASRPQEIAQIEAQLQSANARINLAQERLNRYQFLANQGAVTRDRLDEAQTEYRTAVASREEVQRRLEQTRSRTLQEIAQREASVAEAQSGVAQVQRGTRPEIIAQREASVAEAQSGVAQAQRGTRPEIIAQRAAEVAQARAAFEQAQSGRRPQEIAQLRAGVDAARAQLLSAQVQFQDSVVRAPFNGIVSQKYADIGAFVTPTTSASTTTSATSTAIVAIARGLEIRARVPEVDIGQIQPGQAVDILADAFPDRTFKGRVRLVSPEAVVEQNVTSFEVRVAVETGQEELKSGMNVNVTFLGEEIPNALVVPTVAIVTEKGQTGVMIPNQQNQPEFRPVTIGSSIEDRTQILAGLKPGERVFIDMPEENRRSTR